MSVEPTENPLHLSAFPNSGSSRRESLLHKTRSTSSPSLAPTTFMSSLTKSIHLRPFFYQVLPSLSFFSQRNLLFSSSSVHTNVIFVPRSLKFHRVKIWNSIPNDLRKLSFNQFKIKYKKILLSNDKFRANENTFFQFIAGLHNIGNILTYRLLC